MSILNKNNSAFTLIELLVVIAIIGILSSVVLASLSGARESANITRTVSDLQQIETAMTMWMQNEGNTEWPSGLDYNIKDIVDDTSLDNYLNSVPKPPLGSEPYSYNVSSNSFSCGGWVGHGTNIRFDGISENLAEEVDLIIDGGNSPDLDCGKVRWTSQYSGRLFYSLSDDDGF